jgi:hypothetical protein
MIVEEYLRKMVRNILNEKYGVSMEIDELAEWLSSYLYETLIFNIERGKTYNDPFGTEYHFNVSKELIKQLSIDIIKVTFKNPNQSDTFAIQGNAELEKNSEHLYGNQIVYNIKIEIRTQWDAQSDITDQLYHFFSHELNHALKFVKTAKLKPKSAALNTAQQMSKTFSKSMLNKNPALKNFVDNFYFALPEEVNARVQESFSDIKKHLNKNTNEIIDILHKTKSVEAAKSMLNYNVQHVFDVPENILNTFIKDFNQFLLNGLLNAGRLDEPTNYIHKDIPSFFNFWSERFIKQGHKLFYKIINMVAKAKKENEKNVLFNANRNMLNEVLGYNIFFEGFDQKVVDYLDGNIGIDYGFEDLEDMCLFD